jgi:hypothetical protein
MMKKITIRNDELYNLNDTENIMFPKYTSQLINWANQNAQGTRPKVVGQLSEVFPEYIGHSSNISLNEWEKWYKDKYPNAIDKATEKIYLQVENLKEAIVKIDKEMINNWVYDLVINKTYNGLYIQNAIIKKIALFKNTDNFRLATKEEESKGIDGFVDNVAYSIKPHSYKTMNRLSENIDAKMVYYEKTKTGLAIEIEE